MNINQGKNFCPVLDVSQPSLGADHDLMTTAVGEVDSESPPMRSQVVSVHQRSPGAVLGPSHTMETHWEEAGAVCNYTNKHPRSIKKK